MGSLELRNLVRKSDTITNLLRYISIPIWKHQVNKMERSAMAYQQGKRGSDHSKLESFQNLYDGKRCFIIATGPSLRLQDLDILYHEKELCFGVNSIVTAFSDTKWRPDFYGIQDFHGYSKFHLEIQKFEGIKFLGSNIKKYFNDPTGIYYPHCLLNHNYPRQEEIKPILKFSDCAPAIIYDGYSITYSMIEMAVYMGFKEIYLLGVDCNYASGQPYFNADSVRETNEKHNSTDLMILAFEAAKKFCDKKNIKIYNATRGGKLEVFPRVDFDTLFL